MEGKADRSYGIQVAKLAGLPYQVIERAQEILAQLEGDVPTSMIPCKEESDVTQQPKPDPSLPQPHVILEEVMQMDLFSMTPLEALNRLADLQRRQIKRRDFYEKKPRLLP